MQWPTRAGSAENAPALLVHASRATGTVFAALPTALSVFAVFIYLIYRKPYNANNNHTYKQRSHQTCTSCCDLTFGFTASFCFLNNIQMNRMTSKIAAIVPIPNEPTVNNIPNW